VFKEGKSEWPCWHDKPAHALKSEPCMPKRVCLFLCVFAPNPLVPGCFLCKLYSCDQFL
jgi:hypothetical protein